jgi:hypothetical protein
MERTALSAEMKGHLDRMRELVNTADGQVQVAADAHSRGEDRSLESAHRALDVTIRSMHRTLKSIGESGAKADSDATKTIQTSSGTGQSTGSAGGRSAAPVRNTPGILTNDPAEFLKRARQGSRK